MWNYNDEVSLVSSAPLIHRLQAGRSVHMPSVLQGIVFRTLFCSTEPSFFKSRSSLTQGRVSPYYNSLLFRPIHGALRSRRSSSSLAAAYFESSRALSSLSETNLDLSIRHIAVERQKHDKRFEQILQVFLLCITLGTAEYSLHLLDNQREYSHATVRPFSLGELQLSPASKAIKYLKTLQSLAHQEALFAGQEDLFKELTCVRGLAQVCTQRIWDKDLLILAAGLYNYALHLTKLLPDDKAHTEILKNFDLLENRLLYFCRKPPSSFSLIVHFLGIRNHSIETNRRNLQERREEVDKRIHQLGSDPSSEQVIALHQFITQQMKEFTAELIQQCLVKLGPPPCKYAVIGLGSMAREEMTHYSDLEFAILVEEETKHHKEYFRNLAYLLCLKVVNLGETMLPTLTPV